MENNIEKRLTEAKKEFDELKNKPKTRINIDYNDFICQMGGRFKFKNNRSGEKYIHIRTYRILKSELHELNFKNENEIEVKARIYHELVPVESRIEYGEKNGIKFAEITVRDYCSSTDEEMKQLAHPLLCCLHRKTAQYVITVKK